MNSLFIGRWQPLHKGHIKLIRSVLDEGKSVVIGIRDTAISKDNPYSVEERWGFIANEFKDCGSRVKIIVVPDINEVCYGRDVGYLIRRIQLDEETEGVSATKIRNGQNRNPIIWLTGQSGSGKTTIAKQLRELVGGVILDGDDMRQSISRNAGFTKQARESHNLRVARLAQVLSRDNIVIVSVIAPFQSTRDKITEMIDPFWVYIKRSLPSDPNKPYETPKANVVIDVDAGAYDLGKILAGVKLK